MEEFDCKFFDELPKKTYIQTTQQEIYHHYLPKKTKQVPWTTYTFDEATQETKTEEFYLKVADKPQI